MNSTENMDEIVSIAERKDMKLNVRIPPERDREDLSLRWRCRKGGPWHESIVVITPEGIASEERLPERVRHWVSVELGLAGKLSSC